MVLGELLQLVVAEQVDARVADVHPRDDSSSSSTGAIATSVVPMPRRSGSSFAVRTPLRSRPYAAATSASVVGSVKLDSERLERDLAGDLAAAVAAHAVGDGEHDVVDEVESSLFERTRPTSVALPQRTRVVTIDLQHGVADLQPIALLHDHRTRHLEPVQVGAVGRAEVFDEELAVAGEHACMEL